MWVFPRALMRMELKGRNLTGTHYLYANNRQNIRCSIWRTKFSHDFMIQGFRGQWSKHKNINFNVSEKINTQLNTHERQFFLVPICKPDVRISIESKPEMEYKWLTSDDWTQSLFEWQKLYEYKVWYSSDYSDNSTWNLLPTVCRSCIKQSLVFRWLQNKCGVK